jgi:hypothetical protein
VTALCEQLNAQLGALFLCAPHDSYVRLRTPFLYPDGDVIDLYYSDRSGTPTLTDLGETIRWLRMQSASLKRSPKQQQLIQDVCQTHGVEFFKGMLILRLAPQTRLADGVMRLAQAALRVGDLWFTMRTRTVQSAVDEIAEFLTERNIPTERAEKLVGRSGRGWTVDFHTRTPQRSALVYVLSTGSRAAARSVTEHVVAAWYDLNLLASGADALRFVSLFDDTMDVWAPEDFKLVEPLSEIARWSRPDEFEQVLRAA